MEQQKNIISNPADRFLINLLVTGDTRIINIDGEDHNASADSPKNNFVYAVVDNDDDKSVELLRNILNRGIIAAVSIPLQMKNKTDINEYIYNNHVVWVRIKTSDRSELIVFSDYNPAELNDNTKPIISICIPTFKRKEIIFKALEAWQLSENIHPQLVEIVIVENGSEELRRKDFLDKNIIVQYFNIREGNLGLARKVSVEKATSDLLLLANDDTIPDQKLIITHLHYQSVNCNNNLAILGSFIFHSDVVKTDFMKYLSKEEFLFDTNKLRNDQVVPPSIYFYTNNVSILKNAIIQAGNFSPDFKGYGCEDVELGFRLERLGWRVLIKKDMVAYHYHEYDPGIFLKAFQIRRYAAMLYMKKHDAMKRFYFPNGISENILHLAYQKSSEVRAYLSIMQNFVQFNNLDPKRKLAVVREAIVAALCRGMLEGLRDFHGLNISNVDIDGFIKDINKKLYNNRINGKYNVIFELYLPGQFPFLQSIFETLSNHESVRIYFSLHPEAYEKTKAYLGKYGIDEDKIIPAYTVARLKYVNLFLSPTTWTEFVPSLNIPKVQILHGLADKKIAFGARLDLFNVLFLTGPNHKDVFNEVKTGNCRLNHIKTYDIGYPKLDKVLNGNIEKLNMLDKLNLYKNRPIVIYAPSWETNTSLYIYGRELIKKVAELNVNVLIKLHPMSLMDPHPKYNNGIDWKKELASIENEYPNVKHILNPNINDYLKISDLMITDVSGAGLEFMITNKPIVYVDVPEFFDNTGRGGIEDISRDAGDIIYDVNDIAEVVMENLNNPRKYEEKRRLWMSKLIFNPGNATEKAVDTILELLSEGVETKNYIEQRHPVLKERIHTSNKSRSNLTSIIILNLNGASHIKHCVNSILRYTQVPYELIVIDNGSTDGSKEYLRSVPQVILIENNENVGAPYGRNQGLAIAKGEYIVFMDNDTIVTEGWLDRFIAHFKSNPQVGILGPMSNYVSGPQLVEKVSYRNERELQNFAKQWAKNQERTLSPAGRLILFCMIVRREVITKIGGIDPAYIKWGWEDDDYCVRAQIAGFKLGIANDVYIHHTGSQTSKTANINYQKLLRENWQVFAKKYGIPRQNNGQMQYGDSVFKQSFNYEKHFVSVPSTKEIEKLIYNRSNGNISITENEGKASSVLKLLEQAQSSEANGEYDKSAKTLEKVLDIVDENILSNLNISRFSLLMLTGNHFLKSQDVKKAKEYFELALHENPESSEACFSIARCFELLNIREGARVMYGWAYQLKPEWDEAKKKFIGHGGKEESVSYQVEND